MNIDIQLVAKALDKAGEEPLNKEELENKKGTRWRLISDIYLATIKEELSSVNWTSQKRRKRLVQVDDEENLTSYAYMYELPIDCAKTVSLNSEKEYLVENDFLYTDDGDPILVYITNYFTGKYKYEKAEPQPTEETFEDKEYYILSEEDEEYIKAEEYSQGTEYYVRVEEDYDYYDQPKLDPMLEEAIVCKLASKIVLKLTGEPGKYQLLWQEAQIIENKATKISQAHGHNKGRGNPYWGDLLGLPDYGDR